MKWIALLFSTLCFCTAQAAMAAAPVTISSPTPAIASSYNVGDSNTFTYTITNNVPNKSFPITVSGLSGPVSRATVTSDCGSSLPKGPSTCNVGILIAPTAGNAGQSINQNLSINYQGRTPLVNNIAFSVGSSEAVVLTAVGQDDSGSPFPLLAVSTNGGNSWAVKSVAGMPITGQFLVTSCTGSGSTAICTAAGEDLTISNTPFVSVSTDGGISWAVKSVTGAPVNGSYNGTSCIGSGSTAICISAGYSVPGNPYPLVAASTDGGNTWAVKSVTGAPAEGLFRAASCAGSGSTAVCMAAGDVFSGAPMLAVSTDGGNTWAVKSVSGNPAAGVFYGASCTGNGNGSSAICTAVGQNNITGAPLLAVSTNGGNSWAVKSVTGLPAAGVFRSASCTGSGSSAICTAAGNNNTGPFLLAVSTDGGDTWAVKSVSGIPASGLFFGISCTGSGSTTVCTAAGQDSPGSGPPLLAVSADGANTWAVKSVTGGIPTNGAFYGTSCTGNGSSAICTAAGKDVTGSAPPFLAISTNGGNTWTVKSVTNLPSTGTFKATGATGGS